MVKTLLALLAVEFMLPVQAQWAPHADPGRCENAAGYITVGSSTVCIGQPEGLVGPAGLLSADGVVTPELLAGRFRCRKPCARHAPDDGTGTRMSCRQHEGRRLPRCAGCPGSQPRQHARETLHQWRNEEHQELERVQCQRCEVLHSPRRAVAAGGSDPEHMGDRSALGLFLGFGIRRPWLAS